MELREKIAALVKTIAYGNVSDQIEAEKITDAILAIPEIAAGQKMLNDTFAAEQENIRRNMRA